MGKPLILLDVDGTLLDTTFQMTDGVIWPFLVQMQKKGFVVGLHSDSPFLRARRIAAQLELNGPLICELGNAVHGDLLSPKPIWEDESHVAAFHELFARFILEIKDKFPDWIMLFSGLESVLEWLPNVKMPLFAGVKPWIIVNNQRRHSFCFNVRQLSHLAGIELSPETLEQLAPIALRLFEKIFKCAPFFWYNADPYCSYFLHAPDSCKSKTNHIIFDLLGHQQVIMIGDNPIDNLHDDAVVQCAVGNATDEYKKTCVFVAEAHYTEGARECLEWIEQNF